MFGLNIDPSHQYLTTRLEPQQSTGFFPKCRAAPLKSCLLLLVRGLLHREAMFVLCALNNISVSLKNDLDCPLVTYPAPENEMCFGEEDGASRYQLS